MPRIIALLFICSALIIPGKAQYADIITNIPGRHTTSLNGSWHYITDPYENGFYNYRYEEKENGYFKNAKPENPSDRVEYNFDNSPVLKVPGDWNSQKEKLLLYEGTVWYKRSFNYNLQKDKRLFLYFGAVNYQCHVYLNGKKLGHHEGGFTPFQFEVTDHVKEGENFVVVKADNKRHRDGIPTVNTDWWNYGGITRQVQLIETPETFIKDYSVQLAPGRKNTVKGRVALDKSSEGKQIHLKIPEANVHHTATTNKQGTARFRFSEKLKKWSPERPKTYKVILISEQDTIKDQIGFRTIETKGSKILLNGEEVFLRGIALHEEAPMRGGRAYSEEDAERLLGWAKELGCNYVRLAHYPHNEHMVRKAEEMGLMVWSEIPVYWTVQFQKDTVYKKAKQQLTEMITRDKNRASVIIWAMGNETPVGPHRNAFMKRLTQQARKLDSTRLLSAALEVDYRTEDELVIDDPLAEQVDVLGVNEYIGWYGGTPGDIPGKEWSSRYNKPMVISEFGGGAKYNYHGAKEKRWTEEFQAWLYRNQLDMLDNIDFLAGMSPWILVDFRSPRRHLPEIQNMWNRKGLLSNSGFKKKAWYVMEEYYDKVEKRNKE